MTADTPSEKPVECRTAFETDRRIWEGAYLFRGADGNQDGGVNVHGANEHIEDDVKSANPSMQSSGSRTWAYL